VFQKIVEYYNQVGSKKFANQYKNKTQPAFDFGNILLNDFNPSNIKSFKTIIFEHIHPHKNCLICGTNVQFNINTGAYREYCGSTCARKAGWKGPAYGSAGMSEIIKKRKVSMKKLMNDPIRGPAYRYKLSTSSRITNRNPIARQMRSDFLKARIASGEWTPKITNSRTHWSICIDGKFFRSSFEGLFWLYQIQSGNTNLEFETLRLPYVFEDNRHTYIVDFIDHVSKISYEIKPKSLTIDSRNKAKEKALIEWCNRNKYKYELITEDQLRLIINDIDQSHPFIVEFRGKYPSW
jgi:hypothetical protein